MMDTQSLGKVVVLLGGNGTPRDRQCSIESGGAILQELVNVGVDAEGLDPVKRPLTDLLTIKPARIFNVLYSRDGEDGRLQGWLEYLGVPYTGSGVLASAVCFDKIICKKLLQASDVPTSPFVPVALETWKELDLEIVLAKVGGDAFVKPAREASSIGASRASDVIALQSAIANALERDDHVIVEKFLPGKEFTVPVIDGVALPPCELRFHGDHEFYSARMKCDVPGVEKFVCPSSLSSEKEEEVKSIVLKGYAALGIREYCRADVRQDEKGEFYILEYNTGAILTESGSFAASAYAAGMSYSDMLLKLLANASTNKY